MLQIGDFSKISKVSIKTLRYYDKVGLLKPIFVNSYTNYRYYSEEQLSTLNKILLYKSAGLRNDDIRELIKKQGKSKVDVLISRRQELQQLMDDLSDQIMKIDALLNDSSNNYTVVLKNIPACKVFFCQGYIVSPQEIRAFIRKAHSELSRTNPEIHCSQPDYCCVIYPGDSYRDSNIFIEYDQSVDRIGVDCETLKFKTLESINAICVEHKGNYSTLRDAYLFGVNWAIDNGYEVHSNIRERYIDGAWNKDRESDWLTEIQIPVIKLPDGKSV